MDLSNFRIGISNLNRDKVFLGKVSSSGTSWLHKKDITSEFISTIIDYMGQDGIRDITDAKGKKVYKITVEKL